jgi:hypothetical protein
MCRLLVDIISDEEKRDSRARSFHEKSGYYAISIGLDENNIQRGNLRGKRLLLTFG